MQLTKKNKQQIPSYESMSQQPRFQTSVYQPTQFLEEPKVLYHEIPPKSGKRIEVKNEEKLSQEKHQTSLTKTKFCLQDFRTESESGLPS